jgi:hypothetical protein
MQQQVVRHRLLLQDLDQVREPYEYIRRVLEAGHHEHRDVRRILAHPLEHAQARDAGQPEVEDDERKSAPPQRCNGRRPVPDGDGLCARSLDDGGERVPDVFLIVDDEDALVRGLSPEPCNLGGGR